MKIHTGDTIVVITGKDRGKTGQVLRVLPEKNRVVVTGVNMRTKHLRKSPQRPGQILRYEASIHASNIMLVDPKTKKRTRIGWELAEGKKKRIAKRSGSVVGLTKLKSGTEAGSKEAAAGEKKKKQAAVEAAPPQAPVAGPVRQPFWKRMGFGAEALAEGGEKAPSTQEDRSDKGSLPITRSSGRGS